MKLNIAAATICVTMSVLILMRPLVLRHVVASITKLYMNMPMWMFMRTMIPAPISIVVTPTMKLFEALGYVMPNIDLITMPLVFMDVLDSRQVLILALPLAQQTATGQQVIHMLQTAQIAEQIRFATVLDPVFVNMDQMDLPVTAVSQIHQTDVLMVKHVTALAPIAAAPLGNIGPDQPARPVEIVSIVPGVPQVVPIVPMLKKPTAQKLVVRIALPARPAGAPMALTVLAVVVSALREHEPDVVVMLARNVIATEQHVMLTVHPVKTVLAPIVPTVLVDVCL